MLVYVVRLPLPQLPLEGMTVDRAVTEDLEVTK
jgi:hypothetical protein